MGVNQEDARRYDDMLDLPRPASVMRGRMSNYDRAAQFSPFAALVGYDAAVAETARLTEDRRDLADSERESIDQALRYLRAVVESQPLATFTFFRPDAYKSGGAYVTETFHIRRIDEVHRVVESADKRTKIPIGDIVAVSVGE